MKTFKIFQDFSALQSFLNVIHYSLTAQTSRDIKLMRALCILKSLQHYLFDVNGGGYLRYDLSSS